MAASAGVATDWPAVGIAAAALLLSLFVVYRTELRAPRVLLLLPPPSRGWSVTVTVETDNYGAPYRTPEQSSAIPRDAVNIELQLFAREEAVLDNPSPRAGIFVPVAATLSGLPNPWRWQVGFENDHAQGIAGKSNAILVYSIFLTVEHADVDAAKAAMRAANGKPATLRIDYQTRGLFGTKTKHATTEIDLAVVAMTLEAQVGYA